MRLFRFAAVVVALSLLSSCAPGGNADSFDRAFIDMMVPHHQGAVEMARIALVRAEHPELKRMAQAIIADQDREIAQMKDWRKSWFGSDQTPKMDQMPMVPGMSGAHAGHGGASGTMNMEADVDTLRDAREPFDRAFIDMMIPHHESAIDAAKAAETRAVRPEIKALAQAIITSQTAEIDQLQRWREAWYGARFEPPIRTR